MASCLEACASTFKGPCKYNYVVKQLLDRLPSVCISQSGSPTSAMVEAALMWNKWLLNEEAWWPAAFSKVQILAVTPVRVK